MFKARARGASKGARGAVDWARRGTDSGSRRTVGPSGRRSLVGWACRTRKNPLGFYWRHLCRVYLAGKKRRTQLFRDSLFAEMMIHKGTPTCCGSCL